MADVPEFVHIEVAAGEVIDLSVSQWHPCEVCIGYGWVLATVGDRRQVCWDCQCCNGNGGWWTA